VSRVESFSRLCNGNSDISVSHLIESNSLGVDVDCHEQLYCALGQVSKLNSNALVISSSIARGVVPSMLDSLSLRFAKTNDICLILVSIQAYDRGVKVYVTVAFPPEANNHSVGARG